MHKCDAVLVTCMDWRLHPGLDDRVREAVGGACDLVVVPGGVKSLLPDGDPAVREFLLDSIGISARLHATGRVVLANHTDCGAYGGQAAFGSDAQEVARHRADLESARRVVEARFPSLRVETLLVRLTPAGQGWAIQV